MAGDGQEKRQYRRQRDRAFAGMDEFKQLAISLPQIAEGHAKNAAGAALPVPVIFRGFVIGRLGHFSLLQVASASPLY
jgi:hypothetical protein